MRGKMSRYMQQNVSLLRTNQAQWDSVESCWNVKGLVGTMSVFIVYVAITLASGFIENNWIICSGFWPLVTNRWLKFWYELSVTFRGFEKMEDKLYLNLLLLLQWIEGPKQLFYQSTNMCCSCVCFTMLPSYIKKKTGGTRYERLATLYLLGESRLLNS